MIRHNNLGGVKFSESDGRLRIRCLWKNGFQSEMVTFIQAMELRQYDEVKWRAVDSKEV